MSVTLNGPEGFFNRHGAFIGEFNRVAFFYGSALDAGFFSIWSQYASSDQLSVENLPSAVGTFRNSGLSYSNTLVADGQTSILLQVSRDTSVAPYTIPQALSVLKTQMLGAGDTIQRPTLSNTVTPDAGNISDTTVMASTTNIYGDPLDMTLAETFTLTITSASSFTGNIQAVGELAVSSNAYNWPQGSGASVSLSIIDPASGGLTTDGGFRSWTGTGSNTPVNWDIVNGDAGTTVFKGSALGLRSGTDCLMLTSDGAQLTGVNQSVSLQINTVYALSVQLKKNNNPGSTGRIGIKLTDGDGNTLTDDAGSALLSETLVSSLNTSTFVNATVFFSTPRQLPSTVKLFVGFSTTAPTATQEILVDLMGMVAATPLYGLSGTGTSGPFVAAFSAEIAPAVEDIWDVEFTNNLNTQSFVLGMERLYGLRNMGFYFPSANSPTIPDSLVTH